MMKLTVIPATPMGGGRQFAKWPRRRELPQKYTPNVRISAEREDSAEAVTAISEFFEAAGIDPRKMRIDAIEAKE